MTSSNSYYEKTLATGAVRCIDDEIPFDIPQGWEWCRIKHICSMQAGKNISSAEIFQDKTDLHPYRCVGGNGLRGFVSIYNTTGHYAIVGRQGALCGCLNIENGNFYATEHAVVVDSFNIISPLFLYHFLIALNLNQYATATAQPGLAVSNILEVMFPLPPLSEQARIVSKIETIAPVIKQYEKNEELLRQLNQRIYAQIKASILQEAIQGKLVPQIESEGTAEELLDEIYAEKNRLVKEGKLKVSALKGENHIFRGDDNKYYEQIGSKLLDISEEIPFEIPSSWRWCRIESIFHINPKNVVADESEAAFIPMECIDSGYGTGFTFQLTKWRNIKRGYTHFADGDIAFAKITPCFQNRKSVILHHLPSGIGAGTTELKVLRPMVNLISREYVLALLQSPYFIDEATFKGTANQQRIISGYVENKLFPLPPVEEQKRIVRKIQLLNELII